MMNKLPGTVILLLISIYSSAQPKVESIINTRQLKPAVLHWDFGTLETIYPSEDSLGTYWNVIHRSPEPTKPYDDYDYFKVEGKTLQPLISEMYHRGFIDYRIEFKQQQAEVTIGTDRDTTIIFWISLNSFHRKGPAHLCFGEVYP
jgi:hypothetical protein